VLDCVTVLHLFRAVFSTLTVSLSCSIACLFAFKLFIIGPTNKDGSMDGWVMMIMMMNDDLCISRGNINFSDD